MELKIVLYCILLLQATEAFHFFYRNIPSLESYTLSNEYNIVIHTFKKYYLCEIEILIKFVLFIYM